MSAPRAGRASPLQRADGAAELAFARRDGGITALAHLFQSDPCRVLFPREEDGDPPQAAIVTLSGGLSDGDRVRVAVEIRDGAVATVTTQAAEKIYRASSYAEDCVVDVSLAVRAGATLEWLPQETIVFDGARLRRRTVVDLAPDARLLACEMVALGRTASGESFTHGLVLDSWRIRRDGGLVWADALRLDGPPPTGLSGFGDATSIATAIYAAADAPARLDAAREALDAIEAALPGLRAGITAVNGSLVARFLGDSRVVRMGVARLIAKLRAICLGLPERLPRVWHV
ncbi:MAG: urease accessory protein UreD [Rhodospirillales bacterium]|nr:MAG: urease accessory protein UreD [Rhodospirillales bacterium]